MGSAIRYMLERAKYNRECVCCSSTIPEGGAHMVSDDGWPFCSIKCLEKIHEELGLFQEDMEALKNAEYNYMRSLA